MRFTHGPTAPRRWHKTNEASSGGGERSQGWANGKDPHAAARGAWVAAYRYAPHAPT
jgi:hypothetical protein